MTRITCKTPSTGRTFSVALVNVGTSFTTIAEAPDFSVPDPSEAYTIRDPADTTRTIRPGEIFFVTPLAAKNKTAITTYVEVKLLREDGTSVEFGRIKVPAYDTAFIPLQGRSLFKRNANGANGDRIQVRAETGSVFDVWAGAEEKLSAEHIGVV